MSIFEEEDADPTSSAKLKVLRILRKADKAMSILKVKNEVYAQYKKSYSYNYVKSLLLELTMENKLEFEDKGTKGKMFSLKKKAYPKPKRKEW